MNTCLRRLLFVVCQSLAVSSCGQKATTIGSAPASVKPQSVEGHGPGAHAETPSGAGPEVPPPLPRVRSLRVDFPFEKAVDSEGHLLLMNPDGRVQIRDGA